MSLLLSKLAHVPVVEIDREMARRARVSYEQCLEKIVSPAQKRLTDLMRLRTEP